MDDKQADRRAYHRRWSAAHKDKLRLYRERYELRHPEWESKQRTWRREWRRRIAWKYREQALQALGSACVRCGFTDPRALQIDHKEGNGMAHRRALTKGKRYSGDAQTRLHKDVLANLSRFQLLCANCNWIKRHENAEDGHGPWRTYTPEPVVITL